MTEAEVLAAHTPEALFGAAALESRRGLRRAYARLIKRFGPERSPKTFAHIRALYEQAQAQASAPAPAPASPPPEQPAGDAVEAWLAAAPTVDDFHTHLDTLRALCLQTGSTDALATLYACLDALVPEQVAATLLEVARHPDLLALAVELGADALRSRNEVVDDPAWEALRARAPDARRALQLAWAQLDAWEGLDRPDQMAAVFRQLDATVRAGAPGLYAPFVLRILHTAGYELTAADLDRIEAAVTHYDFDVEDDALPLHLARLISMRRWRAAHDDPKVPRRLLQVLRTASRAGPIDATIALRDLADEVDDLDAALEHLASSWPGLAADLDRIEATASHRAEWLGAWAGTDGQAPVLPGTRVAEQVPTLRALSDTVREAQASAIEAEAVAQKRSRWKWAGVCVAGLCVVFPLAWGLAMLRGGSPEGSVFTAFVLTAAVAAWVFHSLLPGLVEAFTEPAEPPQASPSEVRAAIDQDMREQGLWAHDVASAAMTLGLAFPEALFDDLVDDRAASLRTLSDAHVRSASLRAHLAQQGSESS